MRAREREKNGEGCTPLSASTHRPSSWARRGGLASGSGDRRASPPSEVAPPRRERGWARRVLGGIKKKKCESGESRGVGAAPLSHTHARARAPPRALCRATLSFMASASPGVTRDVLSAVVEIFLLCSVGAGLARMVC